MPGIELILPGGKDAQHNKFRAYHWREEYGGTAMLDLRGPIGELVKQ